MAPGDKMSLLEKTLQAVKNNFSASEYPCLEEQFQRFATVKPLAGRKALYGAPLTRNTQVALLPMLASEAELTVSWPPIIPPDKQVLALLEEEGVECLPEVPTSHSFDVILDCCGVNNSCQADSGYVELTRSGLKHYQDVQDRTCIDIDSTRVKKAETILGTGDGLLRAMAQKGYGDLQGKNVLLFGYGKVGQGICRVLLQKQASITVVEEQSNLKLPEGIHWISSTDTESILHALSTSDFMITATGIPGVIEKNYPVRAFIDSKAVLINMGAEDEYGEGFQSSRVENNKTALNFILEEPTLMKFMDPIFTLFNESAA
ncbi:MAG: NAD(P)-dependent oxidoreductase, partial [Endozoicomonas sp.]